MFTWIAALCTLALAQKQNYRHGSSSTSSSSTSSSGAQQGVPLHPDTGLYPFTFGSGNSGNYADQFFYFYIPYDEDFDVEYRLAVFDCYCGGDRFVIYDTLGDGLQIRTNALGPCRLATPLCKFYQDDPVLCLSGYLFDLNQEVFCGAQLTLAKGFSHNITIQSATSPFGRGTAFVWLYKYIISSTSPACAVGPAGLSGCNLDVNDY